MRPRYWWNLYRPRFALTRPSQMRVVEVATDWMGLFLPGPRSGTVLINLANIDDEDACRATILHELIHAEQWAAGLPLDHGAYFQNRRKEFEALGLDI